MPFGLIMSQGIFQKKTDQPYEKGKNTVGISGVIHVYGNDNTLNLHLYKAMERTRRAAIKLDYDKCTVKSKSCSFFGNIYTPESVKPDTCKVNAIIKMKAPSNKQELQSFP